MNTVVVRLYERVGDIQYYALHVFEHKAIARFSELEAFNNKLSREYTSFPKKSLFSHTKKDNTKLEARRYLLQEWIRDVTNSRNDFEELEKFMIQQKNVYGEVGKGKCMQPSSEHLWNGKTPASLCKSNYNSSTRTHEIHVFDKETQQWPKTEQKGKEEPQDNVHEYLGLRFRDCRDAKISLHYAPWNRDFSIPVIGLMQRHYDTIVATYHEQIVFLYCSAIGKAAYFDVSTFQWHVLHFKLDSTKASYRVAVVAVDKSYHIITPSQHYSINIETMKLHKLTNVSGFPDYTTMSAIRAREYLVVTGGNHQFLYNIVTDSWQKLPTMGCQNTYTMRLYYDNANTVYAVARRSEKGVQVMELYYLELDNKKWMFLGANHDAVFMVSNDNDSDNDIKKDAVDERVELDIMRCLEDTILNKTENIYAGLYTLAKISKEMQDMMELVDTLSTFDRVDLFKREPKMLEAMEACWECDHRLTDKLGLIIVQLVKVDPSLESVIPEKMRAYQKLTTDNTTEGRTYLCPTYSKKKYKNSFTYSITSSSTSSCDYSSPSSSLPSIRKNVVLPNPNVLTDDETNRRDDILQQLRDNNIKVPGFFCCPITTSLIFDPVVAFDGISYEKHVIKEWFAKGKRTSPVTNLIIKTDVIPNTNLKQSIAQFLIDNDIKLS